MNDKDALILSLYRTMVALIVRYPDGLEEIESAYENVVAAGEQMVRDADPTQQLRICH